MRRVTLVSMHQEYLFRITLGLFWIMVAAFPGVAGTGQMEAGFTHCAE